MIDGNENDRALIITLKSVGFSFRKMIKNNVSNSFSIPIKWHLETGINTDRATTEDMFPEITDISKLLEE